MAEGRDRRSREAPPTGRLHRPRAERVTRHRDGGRGVRQTGRLAPGRRFPVLRVRLPRGWPWCGQGALACPRRVAWQPARRSGRPRRRRPTVLAQTQAPVSAGELGPRRVLSWLPAGIRRRCRRQGAAHGAGLAPARRTVRGRTTGRTARCARCAPAGPCACAAIPCSTGTAPDGRASFPDRLRVAPAPRWRWPCRGRRGGRR